VNTREKIMSVAALAERIKQSGRPDARVVLASGRFDLLSRELVEQLRTARIGDVVLVAAIEPSAGADCLLPAEARAQLAAGLEAVDLVVVAAAAKCRRRCRPRKQLK
jgi:bifunctional ADP-heptose synthase (sugar kinase/adenylyltransferase)